jgi:putative glycosyltransferase (TIGR04372 family)
MSQVARQWSQIRAGGPAVLRRKTRAALRMAGEGSLVALNALWALPAVLLMRAMRPWRAVRIGKLETSRVGHFVADTTLIHAASSSGKRAARDIDLFWMQRPTSNAQWERMVERTFRVHGWARYLARINGLVPGGSAHVVPPTYRSRDREGLLQRSPHRLEFTATEDAAAKEWLRRKGWKDGEPFVCLLVRDAAYLASQTRRSSGEGEERWQYHSYRDSDVDLFGEAARRLVEKGYWVIRMGKVMTKRFPVVHPRIVDYPFVDDQDDLLDIWLSAHCAFFISTSAGLDQVAIAYGRWLCIVNSLPYSDSQTFVPSVCAPKRLRWRSSDRELTLREMLDHSHHRTEEYRDAGIVIEDLTPEEIAAVVMECEERVAGCRRDTAEEASRQRRFWNEFKAWPGYDDFHGYLHPEARAGAAWLASMGEDFFAEKV